MTLSVVLATWERPAWLLLYSVHTLSHQTLAAHEIIVVDSNTDLPLAMSNDAACKEYPLVKFLQAPRSPFNLSRAMNYGIKRAEGDYILATCMEMLFSANVIEHLTTLLNPGCWIEAQCGILPETVKVGNVATVHERWGELCRKVSPDSHTHISTGAAMCAERAWWHEIRGYDEVHYPYENPDADLARAARLSGLKQGYLLWENCQLIHPEHPKLSTGYETSSEWYYRTSDTIVRGRVRNPNGWGEG